MNVNNTFIDKIFKYIMNIIISIFNFIFSAITANNVVMIIVYLILVNILAIVMMKIDKKRSKIPDAVRIRERTLLIIALAGGSIRRILCNV